MVSPGYDVEIRKADILPTMVVLSRLNKIRNDALFCKGKPVSVSLEPMDGIMVWKKYALPQEILKPGVVAI